MPLTADTVANAIEINNRGQVVGNSGVCGAITPPPYVTPSHAVLWERDGTPVDLGSLGGPAAADAINDHGHVSGAAIDPNGLLQAFLWTPDGRKLVELKTPAAINDEREIVGFMFNTDFSVQHAFLWKDGTMVDLNSLIPSGSPWLLRLAAGINDAGRIAG